ncbi:MAG: helix-turn-helix domain-containing protein [Prevotella sp.]|nr:helix-turn-helix domain-containing protein [Prevotella sp.]
MKTTEHSHIVDITLEEAKTWKEAKYMDNGLVLTDHIADAPIPQTPARMNFILMALCQQGTATYDIDTRQQTVKPGDLLFISEGHIVNNYQASSDFSCLCILVSTAYYHSFVQNVKNVSSLLLFSMNNPVVALTPREIEVYTNYYRVIGEKIQDTKHHYQDELVKTWLLAMFYDMSNVIWRVERNEKKAQSRADVVFSRFIRLLEEHYRKERRVSWYAKQLAITPKYLSEVVKEVSKRTPNDWIDHYVILEIRVLLKNSTKSIKEITEELNFPNQSFLGKYFKEHVGVSPLAYRKH